MNLTYTWLVVQNISNNISEEINLADTLQMNLNSRGKWEPLLYAVEGGGSGTLVSEISISEMIL